MDGEKEERYHMPYENTQKHPACNEVGADEEPVSPYKVAKGAPTNKTTGEDEPAPKKPEPQETTTGTKKVKNWKSIVCQCFMAMFIAEWGDRTQIAMIGQHASQPLIPVCLGSLLAFFLLTVSAVIVGMCLDGMKLSEKMVHLVSSLSFLKYMLTSSITINQQKIPTNNSKCLLDDKNALC